MELEEYKIKLKQEKELLKQQKALVNDLEKQLNHIINEEKVEKGLFTKFYNKNGTACYIPKVKKETHADVIKKRSINCSGENSPTNKLKEEDVRNIRRLWQEGNHSQTEIARMYNMDYTTINKIINKVLWKHLD